MTSFWKDSVVQISEGIHHISIEFSRCGHMTHSGVRITYVYNHFNMCVFCVLDQIQIENIESSVLSNTVSNKSITNEERLIISCISCQCFHNVSGHGFWSCTIHSNVLIIAMNAKISLSHFVIETMNRTRRYSNPMCLFIPCRKENRTKKTKWID